MQSLSSPHQNTLTAFLRRFCLRHTASIFATASLSSSLAILSASSAFAGTTISNTPSVRHTGAAIGYTVNAVSLSNSFGSQTCTKTPTRSFSIALPASASVRQAVLYWATENAGGDSQVTLSGQAVNASQSWNDTIATKTYHGYRAD
ncbi:MAG: hypothetical protein WBD47_04925, partial [Phormidesmis sp.]